MPTFLKVIMASEEREEKMNFELIKPPHFLEDKRDLNDSVTLFLETKERELLEQGKLINLDIRVSHAIVFWQWSEKGDDCKCLLIKNPTLDTMLHWVKLEIDKDPGISERLQQRRATLWLHLIIMEKQVNGQIERTVRQFATAKSNVR